MFSTNSILLDKDTRRFKLNNRTSGRMRLYLGKIEDDQFKQTAESIKLLDEEQASIIRKKLRFLVTEVINPKKEKKKPNETETYLANLRKWQDRHNREVREMRARIKTF